MSVGTCWAAAHGTVCGQCPTQGMLCLLSSPHTKPQVETYPSSLGRGPLPGPPTCQQAPFMLCPKAPSG